MDTDPFALLQGLAAGNDDVVLTREARRIGVSRREIAYLRSASSQPLVRGTLAVPPVRDPQRAAARAAQLAMPSAVISHGTAAHLLGLQGLGFWFPQRLVDLTLPRSHARRQRAGLRLHFRDIPEADVFEILGLRVTSVARTLADCAAELDRVSFVSLVDNAIQQRLFATADVPLLAEDLRRTRVSRAAAWLGLVDGRSESASETRVRLVLTDAGLAPDDLQILVVGEVGLPIARLDMGYKRGSRRVGVEVDSGEHDRVRALYRDRDKHNALRGMGWDVRQVTARDANRRPSYVIGQVRNALRLD